MANWSDNIEAVSYAVCAKTLAHDGVSEEQLAADVDMSWHMVAAELECRVIDESGDSVGGEIDWERKMDGYRDWMRRHPESRAGLRDRPVRGASTPGSELCRGRVGGFDRHAREVPQEGS